MPCSELKIFWFPFSRNIFSGRKKRYSELVLFCTHFSKLSVFSWFADLHFSQKNSIFFCNVPVGKKSSEEFSRLQKIYRSHLWSFCSWKSQIKNWCIFTESCKGSVNANRAHDGKNSFHPILTSQRQSALLSSGSEEFQFWFGAVHYLNDLKTSEQRWFNSEQHWKRKLSKPKISGEQRCLRADQRWFSMDSKLIIQRTSVPTIVILVFSPICEKTCTTKI